MKTTFWQSLPKPIIALAPMDGYTDSAFRSICKSINRKIILFTEFTSADGIYHQAKTLLKKLKFDHSEKPIIAQLFGKNTETFITAAQYCEKAGFDGIDLNMGCPSKTVVKSEHGIALRKKPDLAFRLVAAVAQHTTLPVSVKTRLGWENSQDLIAFGKGVQEAGAQLITVHGRTYKQGFSDQADWRPIYELKKELSIPVIGNGDVQDIENGMSKLKNLDGFMIGRAAIGNPWVFSDTANPPFEQKIPLILKHTTQLINAKGEKRAFFEIRKHLLAYVKGLPNASKYRSHLVQVSTLNEIHDILKEIAIH